MIEKLVKLAQKAANNGEVPVAAIIVKNNKIIAKAYNKKEKLHNPLFHAEVLAIIKATKKMKNWRLTDCQMYVTLEPCEMCKKIIEESRLEEVYYLCENKNKTNSKIKYIKISNDLKEKYKYILKKFFKDKRKEQKML